MTSNTPISVVIPALDEREMVGTAVASVREHAEVLVVDGGSEDGTPEAAEAAGARVLRGRRGRGAQLMAGAAEATGDWLVFLHADTRLEAGWERELRDLDPRVVGGAFHFALDSPRIGCRVMEFGVWLRGALFRLPYGDQGLFARREAFERSGGFPDQPLLEDVDFVRRLRRLGPIRLLRTRAVTSARRWEETGLLNTMLRNWLIMVLYGAGTPPERLARLYGRRGA